MIKLGQGETTLTKVPVKVLAFDLASLGTLTALGIDAAGVPGGNKTAEAKALIDKPNSSVAALKEKAASAGTGC